MKPAEFEIREGDAVEILRDAPAGIAQTCITSPPYFGLRDYGVAGQIGLEQTLDAYVAEMTALFAESRRVLRDDGTLWLNLGDSYAGSWGAQGHRESSTNDDRVSRNQIANHPKRASNTGSIRQAGLKAKDRMMVPARVALALQADGWWLRDEIVWHKPNPMPMSITDRTTPSHEMIYMLSKAAKYSYDQKSIKEPMSEKSAARYAYAFGGKKNEALKAGDNPTAVVGERDVGDGLRNKRSVWTIPTKPFKEAHFATFPPDLIEPCILAGSAKGDTVLDPFMGAGTTGLVADRLGRNAIGIELNPKYAEMARKRITDDSPLFGDVA